MAHENIIAVLQGKVEQGKSVLKKIHSRNGGNTENYTSNELKRCQLLIRQVNSNNEMIVKYRFRQLNMTKMSRTFQII